jgi:hypothetical protein
MPNYKIGSSAFALMLLTLYMVVQLNCSMGTRFGNNDSCYNPGPQLPY